MVLLLLDAPPPTISASEIRVVGYLGRGAYALVYLAVWQGRDVAIKAVPVGDYAGAPQMVAEGADTQFGLQVRTHPLYRSLFCCFGVPHQLRDTSGAELCSRGRYNARIRSQVRFPFLDRSPVNTPSAPHRKQCFKSVLWV